MHPDIHRDIDQKAAAGLITLMDAKILYKYLAERQTIRGIEPSSLLSEYQYLLPWIESMVIVSFQKNRLSVLFFVLMY